MTKIFLTVSINIVFIYFRESIENLLHDRDIDFSTHSVFLESSKTPLPLAFDTFPLGGNVLHVKGISSSFLSIPPVTFFVTVFCYSKDLFVT